MSQAKRNSRLFENHDLGELLSAKETGRRLNLAEKTIKKWRYERKLPDDAMLKVGGRVKFVWGKVVEWVKEENS